MAHHMRFKDVPNMRESTLKRFLRLPRFAEHLELHRLDCLSSNGRLENYELVAAETARISRGAAQAETPGDGRRFDCRGLYPGAAFSKMLAAVEDAQLEGRISSSEEGLALVKQMFPRSGPPISP